MAQRGGSVTTVEGRGVRMVETNVGWGSGMVHSRCRWPERPQARQRMGSRHSLTRCRVERKRKQPSKVRSLKGAAGVFGHGVGGELATSKKERGLGVAAGALKLPTRLAAGDCGAS
jgi:hypothetical protein